MRENRKIRMLLAVLPVDDFTGKTILQKNFFVTPQDTKDVIRKPDGFWVFTSLYRNQVQLRLYGAGYQEKKVLLKVSDCRTGCPVFKIRVKPDQTYHFPAGAARMETALPKNSSLRVSSTQYESCRKLISDGEAGDTALDIYEGDREGLGGMAFYLTDRNRMVGEWIELTELLDSKLGKYGLKVPLNQSYKKTGARLFPAVCYETENEEEKIDIALPAGKFRTEEPEAICRLEQEGQVLERKIVLACGQITRLEL